MKQDKEMKTTEKSIPQLLDVKNSKVPKFQKFRGDGFLIIEFDA